MTLKPGDQSKQIYEEIEAIFTLDILRLNLSVRLYLYG